MSSSRTFNPVPSLPPPPPETPYVSPSLPTKGMMVGVIVGIGIVVVAVGIFIYFYKKRKWKRVQEGLGMENNNRHSHARTQALKQSASKLSSENPPTISSPEPSLPPPYDSPPPPPETPYVSPSSEPKVDLAVSSNSQGKYFDSPPSQLTKGMSAEVMIVGIGIVVVVVVVAVGFCIYFCMKRKGKRVRKGLGMENNNDHSHATTQDSSTNCSLASKRFFDIAFSHSQSTFSYEELERATNGFSNVNLIGEGGFGYVYKGVLPNRKVVAIKKLKSGSNQGEREFWAEIEVISRVHHRHLVSLVGYCISGAQRILVYDFVPNYTLNFHLHGRDRPTMNWPTRMKIALSSAKGLAYLHEGCQPKIIHCDIKAANILLDYNFEANIADFGLAKFSLDTQTHITTRVMGSYGYLAPEYAATGKLTDKSDVFSFGVVLLELITGHRPDDRTKAFTDGSMVEWARPLLTEALGNGKFDGLVDPRLHNNYSSSEMDRMVVCAAACVRRSSQRRPRMSKIVHALKGNIYLDDLHEGIPPGQSTRYKEDKKKFSEIQEKCSTSHEYSGPSSEFGSLHPSASSSDGQQTTQEM